MLLAPSTRLKSSRIPLALDEVSKRIHVYLPEQTPLTDVITSLVGSSDIRISYGEDYFQRFQRECPGSLCVLAGDREQTIEHLLASASIPCSVLALTPLATNENQLSKLKEALRQAELREVVIRDWMVQRFLPANIFVRDLLHDLDNFGPLLQGTEEHPSVVMEWTSNLLRERTAEAPVPGEGLLTGLPVLLDLCTWLFFTSTSLIVNTDAMVLSAKQWPLPVAEDVIKNLFQQPELPASWQAISQQGLVLDPANGTSVVLLKDIHFGLTVQGDYEAWPTTDTPARLEFTVHGLNTTVQSFAIHAEDDSPQQQIQLMGRDSTHQQRLENAVEMWFRRNRNTGGKLESTDEVLTITFPNGVAELHRAAREAMEQFLRYCRYPQHADLSELDNQYMKAAITLCAVEMAKQNSSAG